MASNGRIGAVSSQDLDLNSVDGLQESAAAAAGAPAKPLAGPLEAEASSFRGGGGADEASADAKANPGESSSSSPVREEAEREEELQRPEEEVVVVVDVAGNRDGGLAMESEERVGDGAHQADAEDFEGEFDIHIEVNPNEDFVGLDALCIGEELEGISHEEGIGDGFPTMDNTFEDIITVNGADGVERVESKEMGQHEKTARRRGRPPKVKKGSPFTEVDCSAKHPAPSAEVDGDEFVVSNLVWGKVRSHPWWPGQIFDPFSASELAMKHMGNGDFLVAYFGDKTFAWRDKSQLKHFEPYFAKMENQSSVDTFVDAVNDALDEVSKRVETGLSCLCIPEGTLADLKRQKIDNAGIQDGTLSQEPDRYLIANSFKPDTFVGYVKALARCPCESVDRLEFVTADAQLKSFYRSKGYLELPRFYFGGIEDGLDVSYSEDKVSGQDVAELSNIVSSEEISAQGKRRGPGKPLNKEKIAAGESKKRRKKRKEVNVEDDAKITEASLGKSSFYSKEENVDDDGSPGSHGVKRKSLDSVGDLETKSPSSRHRLPNVGESMRRVASLMATSPPIGKLDEEKSEDAMCRPGRRNCRSIYATRHDTAGTESDSEDDSMDWSSSASEMLAQLHSSARDPAKVFSFLPSIVSFIMKFREEAFSTPRTERRKSVRSKSASLGTSNHHVQDSYWADFIFENSSDDSLLSKGSKRRGSRVRRPSKKKQQKRSPDDDVDDDDGAKCSLTPSAENVEQETEGPASLTIPSEKQVHEPTPTALVLSFNASDAIPSEAELI